MEVQQMTFDGERICSKRRTIADVRYRLEAFFVYPQPGDVDAVGRDQFVITREVDGRHGVLLAIAAAAAGIREDAERPAQQCSRATDISLGNQLTDFTVRSVMAAQRLLRKDASLEAALLAQLCQRVDVALRLVAEVEVVAFVYLARLQRLRQNFSRKILSTPHGKIACEG